MTISYKKIMSIIKYFLIFIYIVLVYMYGGQNKYTYVYKIPLALLCIFQLVDIIKTKKIYVQKNIKLFYLLAFFSFFSSFWAINSNESIENAKTLFLLTTFLMLLYNFLCTEENSLLTILKITMYAGIVFSIYVFYYYGFSNFFKMLSMGLRIGYEIDNINRIGVETTITFLIALYFGINSSKKYLLLLPIPLLIAIGTGSKKVLVILIIGLFLLIISKKDKNFIISFLKKTFITIAITIGVSFSIITFGNISLIKRFDSLYNLVVSSGKVDQSTITRRVFIKAGFNQFLKTPILGVGSANSGYITQEYTGGSTYLHNNYVELLATMGIIGFILFYYNYLYFICCFIKNKLNNKDSISSFMLIFIVLILVMDIATVSYYSKVSYIYFLILILAVANNKNTLDKNNSIEEIEDEK